MNGILSFTLTIHCPKGNLRRAEEAEWGLLLDPVIPEQTFLRSITMKGKHWWGCLQPAFACGKSLFLVREPIEKFK